MASTVKNRKYSTQDLQKIRDLLFAFKNNKPKPLAKPKYKSLPRIYSDKELDDLLIIRAFIEELTPDWAKKFFLLAFISIVEPVSNRIKDGNGIKIAKNKKSIDDIFGLFESKISIMLEDLKSVEPEGLGTTIFGSMLDDSAVAE